MHELGMAESILDLVRQHVPLGQSSRVRAIRVRVGELSGVQPESLDFCFGAIVAGTPFAQAFLAIEPVAARGRCADCGTPFGMASARLVCPACGGSRVALTSGRELQVVEVELEDGKGAAA